MWGAAHIYTSALVNGSRQYLGYRLARIMNCVPWIEKEQIQVVDWCVNGLRAPNGNKVGGMRLFNGGYRVKDNYFEKTPDASIWPPGKLTTPGEFTTSGKRSQRDGVPWEIDGDNPCPGGMEGRNIPGLVVPQWLVSHIVGCKIFDVTVEGTNQREEKLSGLHYQV